MFQKLLEQRIGAVQKVSVAVLKGYDLRFHKVSKDGFGKCDAYFIDNDADHIWGVLFDIPDEKTPDLDFYEGAGRGYDPKNIMVDMGDRKAVSVLTYCTTDIDPTLVPYDWYMKHVLKGAVENALPDDYLETLKKVKALKDSDAVRAARELELYSGT